MEDAAEMEVMTAVSTGGEAMVGEADGPQAIWNVKEAMAVEEVVDSMLPKEARYTFKSDATTYPGFAGRWTPDAHLHFVGSRLRFRDNRGRAMTTVMCVPL